nr:MAG TPA: 4-Hydroxyphenylacetate decarboxylase subunit gamma [Caudoviricetes sp.]
MLMHRGFLKPKQAKGICRKTNRRVSHGKI